MRAWLEVDLDILGTNYEIVRKKIGHGVGTIAVVKSDAYGHGIMPVSRALSERGVDAFAVISLDEAMSVRSVSNKPILIMGYLDQKEIVAAIEQDFVLSLYEPGLAILYERLAQRANRPLRAHLKVETGLNRLGLSSEETAELLANQHHFPHLKIEALFSHLASAGDREENLKQLRRVQELLVLIQDRVELLPIHLVSSGALANFPEGYFDSVRIGLAFYGVEPVLPGLEPTLTCKSVVMQVKPLASGEGVSYGHLFVAPSDMIIAVVAIGYGEGYTQMFTGHTEVLIQGHRCRVLGKICMNLLVADVTHVPSVKRGDEVVLIGSQRDEAGKVETMTVADLAKRVGLRHHEIITRLGTALPRVYLGG